MWGASQLLTSYFSASASPPGSFWLAAVRTIAPTPYMDGTELDEPDNEDYSRVEIPNNLDNWSNASAPQEVISVLPVSWPLASTDWGPINYWALCNAQVDGYNLLVGALENPVQIDEGDQMMVSEGDLSVTLGPFFLIEEQ